MTLRASFVNFVVKPHRTNVKEKTTTKRLFHSGSNILIKH